MDENAVIENRTASTIYEVPLIMESEGLDKIVLDKLNLPQAPPKLDEWRRMVHKIKNPERTIKIALVGKYVELPDAYISVVEALHHAGIEHSTKVKINFVNAEKIEAPDVDLEEIFSGCRGILVPGGFGDRGIEGKIKAITFARVNKIPFLGLCLGMQCAAIEFARNVCNFADANSTEFNPETEHPVIALMDSQVTVTQKGGTMRLGAYPCKVFPNTHTAAAYCAENISERHRHRFEFNNKFRDIFKAQGMIIAGVLPDDSLVEIIELDKNLHPWFVGCQFHPELKSRPNHPHPLFRDFVGAALKLKYQ